MDFVSVPELFFLGFVSLVSISAISDALVRVQSWRETRRLERRSFGIGLLDQEGQRSRLEYFLIQELRGLGAVCVLGGRTKVREQVLNTDVLDNLGWANPEYAIIGVVREVTVERDLTPDDYTKDFEAWFIREYPQAFTTGQRHWGTFRGERALFETYDGATLVGTSRLYQEKYSQPAYRQGMNRTIILQADCHCADGTVVASWCLEEGPSDEDVLETYAELAKEMIAKLRIQPENKHFITRGGKARPSFTQEIFDGLARVAYAANGVQSSDPRDNSGPTLTREELIAADQPYQSHQTSKSWPLGNGSY